MKEKYWLSKEHKKSLLEAFSKWLEDLPADSNGINTTIVSGELFAVQQHKEVLYQEPYEEYIEERPT